MKLVSAHVTNYRNILDSEKFKIEPVTCLVGKNESGKTALLHALTGLNPLLEDENVRGYDRTLDYPRRYLTEYEIRHPNSAARVVSTEWELAPTEVRALEAEFGKGCVNHRRLIISKSYEGDRSTWIVPLDEKKALRHLVKQSGMTANEQKLLGNFSDFTKLMEALEQIQELSDGQKALKAKLDSYRNKRVILRAIDILSPRQPKFFYFSHYDRMDGQVAIDQLQAKKETKKLEGKDRVFLAFLDLLRI